MVNKSTSIRNSWQKNILMFLLLYFSALTSDIQTVIRVVLFLMIAIGAYTHLNFKVPVKIYLFALSFFLTYLIGQYIIHGQITAFTIILRYTCYILIGSYFSIIFARDFWHYYDKIIFPLALISLLLYLGQIISYNTIYSIIDTIYTNIGLDYTSYAGNRNVNYANAIIYTLNNNKFDDYYRNSGFVFEPGYYASLLCFAAYYRIILLKSGFKDLKTWIYLITIGTTVSTTGFLMVCIILADYAIALRGLKKVIAIPLAIMIIIMIYSLSVVSERIITSIYDRESREESIQIANQYKSVTISLGRFEGFVYHFNEVKNRAPVLGFVGVEDKMAVTNIRSANGLGMVLYYFGFLGLILFIGLLFNSCRTNFMHEKGKNTVLFIIVLISLFSFPYNNALLLWFMLMYGLLKNISVPKIS